MVPSLSVLLEHAVLVILAMHGEHGAETQLRLLPTHNVSIKPTKQAEVT